jgi:hypothetical protein
VKEEIDKKDDLLNNSSNRVKGELHLRNIDWIKIWISQVG